MPRHSWRWNRPTAHPRKSPDHPVGLRTLVVGSGSAGRTMARELRAHPDYGLAPIGFLDDDPAATTSARLRVLGTLGELSMVVRRHRIEVVVVAIPSLPAARMATVLSDAVHSGAKVRYLPSFHAATQRPSHAGDLLDVPTGLLLGRDEVQVVRAATRAVVAGRRVLVTGAGGSIGSELCRQIRRYAPAALYMLDHDESNLHRLQLEISGEALLDTDEILVADIRDEARLHQIFTSLRPQVVFHAAAHKHLPLLERHPCEGVKSNVLGTAHVAAAAAAHGCERLVLISTDKAAAPSSVLGATKRLAESVVRSHAGETMATASVRFGNVLGSRGSLLHTLAYQVAAKEPVTITDPDADRFFMTVEEAVGLVLEAAAMAEAGETFVLDMGEPVRIRRLVEAYIAHVGATGVEVRYTGLRPGEKLSETLFSASEHEIPTSHPRISATQGGLEPDDLAEGLERLYAAAASNEPDKTRAVLGDVVPEYTPPPEPSGSSRTMLAALYADEF